MNCLEFRRAVGAEPHRITADAKAHMGECPTCAKYAQEMQRLDGLIKRAIGLRAFIEHLRIANPRHHSADVPALLGFDEEPRDTEGAARIEQAEDITFDLEEL